MEEFCLHLPCKGELIQIKHVKLSGREINLGKALIEYFNEKTGEIKLKRIIHSKGFYNGINVEKNPGDYAITETKIGEWYLKTTYYSNNGESKGVYININTPIELYSTCIRYVDLEIDVCITREGKVLILDEDKLMKSYELELISDKLLNKVKSVVNHILNEIVPKISL
ncbi:MAG: hypothetical protein DRJ21_02255 [Candidatus Methanomethylicota archaeon]|uniref:DUF402 domain-containing protein n=1 Tax=Thermoproteota archaeon TaxID=2056631 RepID=A0A497ESE7_9CREN|nr:MAG: hypothetical protein DRJ21_02255 [Candidatus Verstraetearchaeota archaeon]